MTHYRGLRGPGYLRALRAIVLEAGVTILVHHLALELLRHVDGAIGGARGEARQRGSDWTVRAGAVVLETGGCAFFSHLLGSRTNTGDGYLMAAEAGTELSSMEFSSYYTVAPAGTTMTRSMAYVFARYFDDAGHELDIPPGPGAGNLLAKALLRGSCLVQARPCSRRHPRDDAARPAELHRGVDRHGIDPWSDRFAVTLRGEGTVRGIGGIRVVDAYCSTGIAGLYAAGDAASREHVAGAVSGGGAQNSAWALSSGQWPGAAAAAHAAHVGRRTARAHLLGNAGLQGRANRRGRPVAEVIAAVQAEMEPLDRNLFRTGPGLAASLTRLDEVWRELRDRVPASEAPVRWRLREAAAGWRRRAGA